MLRKFALSLVFASVSSLVACAHETAEQEDEGAARGLAACAARGGAAPETIADVVDRINELPMPSIPCLVASLPRPFSLVASISPVSAQPSTSIDNPRLFIMYDTLTLSVVPAGEPSQLIEFGERVTPVRSLKAELLFPITGPLAHSEPYERPAYEGQSFSSCGSCHADEERHPTIANAFVSSSLRPAAYAELALEEVRALRAACDEASGELAQCELLRALFDYGDVRQGAFDLAIPRGF